MASFDGESLLNVLLCSSDEFRGKINKEIVLRIVPSRAGDTRVAEGVHGQSIFFTAKIKKGKQREKRVSKRKLLKGCHQGENVTVLVMFIVLF